MKRSIWTNCTGIIERCHLLIAAILLAAMLGLTVGSMSHRSAIIDEVAHIPASYSYDHYLQYRLNPEHPPLMKLLAGIPLQFMHLNFPAHDPSWTTEINGEWDAGWSFLYHMGNSAAAILFWARLPIALVTVAGGGFLYWFTRWRYGIPTALLATFFYCFSPNLIGNGGLVTTDAGAAVFALVALAAFVVFCRYRSWRWVVILGLALAGAQLAKFNGAALYLILGLLIILMSALELRHGDEEIGPRALVWRFLVACLLSLVLIYLTYLPLVWNVSTTYMHQLINYSLPGYTTFTGPLNWLAGVPGGKPLAEYLLGLVMVLGRIGGGNVTYFFGVAKNGSFSAYFPAIFALKTQISFLILLIISMVAALSLAWHHRRSRSWSIFNSWLHKYWVEVTFGFFVLVYFAIAVNGNLDLGIRHILPVYPPLFILVAAGTVGIWRKLASKWKPLAAVALGGLLAWYAVSAIWIYPNYLTYYNELIGGPANADKYFSDSSVDWGQSMVQLQQYLDKHPEIHVLALDYFGGGYLPYYFCTHVGTGYDCDHSRVIEWHSQNGFYPGQYIAVSETYLENDRYYSAQTHSAGYSYLRSRQPIARIGYSIYLYKMY